ncbi:hypothetical protein ACLX1H_007407 [Fusarium chlamydosporum]
MAAIKSLMTRDSVAHLAKRQNWAAKEAGVIVVFCIVGIGESIFAFESPVRLAIGLIGLFLYKKAAARKANKASAV